jgi:CRISPR-associated endonuclease Csn1
MGYNWGVEAKNRDNNLHHAEDAIILAFSTQGEVQRMSTISAKREDRLNHCLVFQGG